MNASSGRLRVAVIGVGHLGRHHVRLLAAMPHVELVAAVDLVGDRARAAVVGTTAEALEYYRQADLGRPRGTQSNAHLNEESRKELYRNPKLWYEKEANKILSESRRRRSA